MSEKEKGKKGKKEGEREFGGGLKEDLGKENMRKNLKRDSKVIKLMFENHWQVTMRVIAITVTTIVICGLIGFAVDRLIGTYPLLMIIGLVGSYPLSQYLVYKATSRLIKK